MDIETVKNLFGDALSSQVASFTFAFTLAAFIHSGRVKKEIAAQMSGITDAIKELGAALRADLKEVRDDVDTLSGRVSKLEIKGD